MTELASPATRSLSAPLAEWVERNIRLDGRPLRFDGHEYLRAIYEDQAPHVVLSKAAQIGGTTWAILRSIHACMTGLNVAYYFPTRTDVIDFSKSRVGPLLADNPLLASQVRDTDTAGLKRIGEANLYMRGMQSTTGLKSVPADMLVFDELDESPPESKAMAKERLAHSDYKRILELSNPSLPDYGVDREFQLSDQRHWTIKCGACGEWTSPVKEFPTKLGQEVPIIRARKDDTYYLACIRCGVELDLAAGEWVPEFPDNPIHGYRISQLISSKVDPGEILSEYRTTQFPNRFYNLKVGIPWADLSRRLDLMSVLSLCTDREMLEGSKAGCVMGVDTGKDLHVVILAADGDGEDSHSVVFLCECHEFGELDVLMKRYSIDTCVIDGLPETHATREFKERHRSHVYLCFFSETQRGGARFDRNEHRVGVNRTEAIDASRAAIRDKRVSLPRRQPIVEMFGKHMTADAKVLFEDEETGIKRYKYVRTAVNHFSMAFTYAWLAAMNRRLFRIRRL